MSLIFVRGDLFATHAKILVNPCNCVGVMGGGLAAHFKRKFPAMYNDYAAHCLAGKLKPGGIHSYADDSGTCIFNLATKDHWKKSSRYEWVEAGLKNIAPEANAIKESTIAMPALGCGLGGLSWDVVKTMIEEVAASDWAGLDVQVFEPFD